MAKKELNIQELIEKYAATPSVAKTIYKKLVVHFTGTSIGTVDKKDLMGLTINDLIYGFGFGRASLEVMVQVLCDLAGKK